MRMLPLKKGYAAFDIYKLIAQRPSKVHMTNSDRTMPRIFTFLSHLLVSEAFYIKELNILMPCRRSLRFQAKYIKYFLWVNHNSSTIFH